ncbi:conserved hypothetical protein [Thermotomaculum hydrothermale]|uniref:DUF505 domain-containing protein n=1 Tax=Thermotomaculum hydrothermale TaxID=981385 RepID=A0A7R6PWN4_9BACT|nr:DUF505 domain-containing protein [Thermotomaculum hydrothermale]BBB32000.1 conserved hypothetical protein [Thermotomaculum hydrothermale]
MIVKKVHAEMLLKLLNEKKKGEHLTVLEEKNENVIRVLEREGLLSLDSNLNARLTYAGEGIAILLNELIESGKLSPVDKWEDDWKWLGSSVIAMLDSAQKGGKVTDVSLKPLQDRGFVEKVKDDKTKKEFYQVNEAGKVILDLFKKASPLLVISSELANFIRELPAGPTLSSRITGNKYYEHLLEAMRLIAYSVPSSDIFAFTALGQAVKNALETGGFVSEGYVITPDILISLAELIDGNEISDKALTWLQALAFVDSEKNLLPAGEWAMEAYRLWKKEARTDLWSFSLEEEEVAVLEVIEILWKKNKENPEIAPTFEQIKKELVDRKIKEYKKLLDKYGKKIKEMPEKYRKIAEEFAEAKNYEKWFDDNFNLRIALFSLESFNLIETVTNDNFKELFSLTEYGEKVLEDQKIKRREISSSSVKSITMTRKEFSSPNIEWYEKAKEEGLIGSNEPTKSGYFYAYLAENIERKPYLTKYEHEIFKMIPEKGVTVDEVLSKAKNDDEKRKLKWALEKLEARHFIEILPDGNIVETEAGKLMDKALGGVASGFATPVTPVMYRVIKALKEVGSLYQTEKKVRILPKKYKEAVKKSGLSEEVFAEAFNICKKAGFVGVNTVNETGLLLLEAVDLMNPEETLEGYTDIYEYKKGTVKE